MVTPNAPSDYPKPTAKSLLIFTKMDGLTLNGGGTIDGRGLNWWKSCVVSFFPFILNTINLFFKICYIFDCDYIHKKIYNIATFSKGKENNNS